MGDAADDRVQFGVGDFPRVSPFVAEYQRRLVVLEAQQVLREVQLHAGKPARARHLVGIHQHGFELAGGADAAELPYQRPDRKSTRLNSSHPSISYAVFCLKKKKNKTDVTLAATCSD